MKTRTIYVLAALICTVLSARGTTYYSQGSYNPASKNNWHINRSGGPGSGKPGGFNGSGDIFVIQNGHNMSTTSTWNFDCSNGGIVIENGGSLTLDDFTLNSTISLTIQSGGTFTINNGNASGYDLVVNGTLINAGTLAYSSSGTGQVASGGIYQHNMNGGSIPTFNWASGSTCEITGVTNTRPNNIAQTYCNFKWNCASQSADVVLAGGFTTSMTGSLTVSNTNSYSLVRVNGSSNSLTIGGSLTIASGTTFNLTSGAGSPTIDLAGDLTVAGTLTKTGSGTAAINFNNSSSAVFSKTGTISSAINFTVNSGAALNFGQSALTGSGTFTAQSGSTLLLGHASGILSSGADGNIQVTGTRTYSTGANYYYGGSSSQVFGNGLPATVNNLTIDNGNTNMLLSGSLTVNGTLTLTNGKLAIGASTLSLNGGFSGSSANSLKSSGSSTHLSIAGSGSMGTLYFDQTTSGRTNRIGNLTVNRIGQTITLGNTLEVTGVVTPTAGTLASAGYLTLVSNSSGTASIAAIGGSSDVTGNVTVQRYIPPITRRYRMMSSPVQNFTWAQLSDDMFVTGSGGATNGFDASNNNSASVQTYHESTAGGRGWKSPATITSSVSAGTGMYVFVRGDRTITSPDWYMGPYPAQNEVTVDFVGQPINKGTISPAITYTSTGSAVADGWNLVGNPYPSAIDWTLLSKSNLSAFYYTYDPASGSSVASNGSMPIAPGQAFFVQAIGSSPSITFTESAKVSSAPASFFKTASLPLTVKMVKDATNSDVAFLSFNPSASKAYSVSEDALKFANALINLGFCPDTVRTVQYNSVPMPAVADTFMMIANAAAGAYTLEFSNISSAVPSSKSVYLRDLFTNTVTDLRSTTSYTFSITSAPASSGKRFEIIIVDPSQLPVEWVSFRTEASSNDANLTWVTANERNNSHFVVERSSDGARFTEASRVEAAGQSAESTTYSFTDRNVLSAQTPVMYYRIRQVDFDGSSSLSPIGVVRTKVAANLSGIFPNPAATMLNVEVPVATAVTLTVTDLTGREVMRRQATASQQGLVTLNVEGLMEGSYFVSVNTSLETRTLKFVKSN